MKKLLPLVCLFNSIYTIAFAQDTSKVMPEINPFTISAYLEGYYCYDLAKPATHERPDFVYSHKRHNEVNLNLGYIKAAYSITHVRANLAFMAGTYAEYNMAYEQGLLKNIFEANAGIKLSQKHDLWLDAGILPSHIGFESAVGKDCRTLTRSMLADNSPYFEAGAKLGYTSGSGKWYIAAMYLNGWQRIQKVPGNQTPAFGTQLTYKPGPGLTLNWSTYAGNEKPDSTAQWRYFNNFYILAQLSEKVGINAGFDFGFEQISKNSTIYNTWYSPVVKLQYKFNDKWYATLRGEYYSDPNGVIIAKLSPNGFRTAGFSMNIDYLAAKNIMLRIEARTFQSRDKIFVTDNKASRENYFFTTALAVSF